MAAGASDWVHIDFVTNAAPAAQLFSRVFDPFNILELDVMIVNYSASSTFRIQFNGDTGTTAYSYAVSENFAAPTNVTSGTAAGWAGATTNAVPRMLTTFRIQNFPGQPHGGWWKGSSGSNSAGTAPVIVNGAGVWATTTQITRITVDVGPGGGTLNAGAQLWVRGLRG